MLFKRLETSNKLLKLVDENYVSSESEEECKAVEEPETLEPLGSVEESKAAVLAQLPEDYNLVEEVQDEEEDYAF